MKKLYIENFGPVSKAELDLKDLNILIGEQSIGKSTIAKLITILTDYSSLAFLISMGSRAWEQHMETYNLHVYRHMKYLIKYETEERDLFFHIEIKPDRVTSFLINAEGKRIVEKKKIQEEIIKLKRIYHQDLFWEELKNRVKELKSDYPDGDRIVSSLKELLYNSLYIPAERIVYSLFNKLQPAINLMKDSVPTTLLRFMIELTNAQTKIPQYDSELLGIKYIKESAEDFFIEKSSNRKYPLSSASSGIQSTLPLMLVLEYALKYREYSSFVIEEPESNLFPSKQVELLRFIVSAVKNESRIVTITTHSPYLLSASNNSLYAGILLNKYGEVIKTYLPNIPYLNQGDCSVYSLGTSINGNGVYCKSLMDEKTGLIDTNGLDGVSFQIYDEFEQLENAQVLMQRNR